MCSMAIVQTRKIFNRRASSGCLCQKHKLPRSSARHTALPVEPEGLAKVMDPVSIRAVENSLQTEQSVAPVTQPTRLIGRWLLLVCWDKCFSVWVEREVGGVFKTACRERERERLCGLGRMGEGWQEVWISQRRISSSSQSWSWGGILVCIVACFASKMTLSFQTNYGCVNFLWSYGFLVLGPVQFDLNMQYMYIYHFFWSFFHTINLSLVSSVYFGKNKTKLLFIFKSRLKFGSFSIYIYLLLIWTLKHWCTCLEVCCDDARRWSFCLLYGCWKSSEFLISIFVSSSSKNI